MKRVKATKASILLCSIILVSNVSAVNASQHHGSHHGANTPQKKYQKALIPMGIQLPENVLSSQEVSCISADSNIYEIINKVQRTCRGTDIRCTFYHFLNHRYQNIGTLDLNKKLFDDLLMKFDNWLLTAENIGKDDVPNLSDHKGKEENIIDTVSININDENNEARIDSTTDSNEANGLHTTEDLYINKFDHNANEFDYILNTNSHETHHQSHRNKENGVRPSHMHGNGNYVNLDPEYNKKHRYFEVFLPKDTEKRKPRTIYVEVDQEKNEFLLIDEEIYKKLKSNKPVMIELDELSEIADTAFNNMVKSSIHNQKDDSNDDERAMTSGISTNSAINDDSTNVEEPILRYSNPSDFNICNLANQKLIPVNTSLINVSQNIIVPNKYMNQAQFYVESQLENPTDDRPTNNLKLLESNNNETDTYKTSLYKETLNTLEYNNKNSNTDLDLNNTENSSLENIDIPYKNEIDNLSEKYEFSKENENMAPDNDYIIELKENNNVYKDFDNSRNLLDTQSSNILHQNRPLFEVVKPLQENNPTTYISGLPKITSYPSYITAGIPVSTVLQFHSIPSQNQSEHTNLKNLSPFSTTPLTSHINVPLLESDSAKVLETEPHLQSSFPAYAVLDSPASSSQNTLLNSNNGHLSLAPNIFQYTSPILSSPAVESMVKPTKNEGFSCTPSYLPIEDLRLPCTINPSLLDRALSTKGPILSLPVLNNESPLPIPPLTAKEIVNSPLSIQEIPPHLQPTKPNPMNLGLIKYSPIDSSEQSFCNQKKIMQSKNRNPCLEPLQPIMCLKPISTNKESDFLPLSLDGTNLCLNGDYSEESKPIRLVPFLTNTSVLPIHPLFLGSRILPNPNLLNECENPTVMLSSAIPNLKSHKTIEVLPTNLISEELTLKSDFPNLIPLDSSLISPHLKIGSSPIIIKAVERETIPIVSQENIQKTDSQEAESENIILPSSLLPTLLDNPVHADLDFKTVSQNTQLNDKLGLDTHNISTNLEHEIVPLEIVPAFDSETKQDSILDTSILHKIETPEISTTLNSENKFDSSLIDVTLQQKTEPSKNSPVIDSVVRCDNFVIGSTLEKKIDFQEKSPVIDQLESFLISPNLHQEVESKNILPVFDSGIQMGNSFEGSNLHYITEPPVLGPKNVLKSNLHQEMKTLEISSDVNTGNQLDSSLICPNSLTMTKPLLSNEIQIINEELQPELHLTNLIPIDSSLIHSHTRVDSERLINQLEKSRDVNPEISLTSVINPDLCETTDLLPSNLIKEELLSVSDYPVICERTEFLPSDLIGKGLHLESNTPSDIQKLSSMITSPFRISKSKLSPSEIKSSDKLFLAKVSSENIKYSPSTDLQTLSLNTLLNTPLSLQDDTASELSPIELNSPDQKFSEHLCLNSESLDCTQGVPNIPINSFSSPLTFNMQNLIQASPELRPASNLVSNAPDPLISSTLLPFPAISKMYTPIDAIAPSSVLIPNTLSLDKNVPLLSKTTHSILLPNIESTICNSENNPIVFDDIMPVLDESSFQLPMKTSVLPSSQSSVTTTIPIKEKSEIIPPGSSPTFKTRPVLPIPITNLLVPSPIYTNPLIDFNYLQNIPYMIPRPKNQLCNLQPYSNDLKSDNIPLLSLSPNPLLNLKPKIAKLPSNTFTKTLSSLAPSLKMNKYHLQQNIPCGDVIESNLQISPLTEEVPSYNCIEESNDKDEKLYKEPLHSFSYTLAPKEMAKPLIDNYFEKQVDVKSNLPGNLASEAMFQTRPRVTPITSLPSLKPCSAQTFISAPFQTLYESPHSKPITSLPPFKPCPAKAILPSQPSIKEPHNIPVVPSSNPLRSPNLLPSSVLPSPLLKPLSPISPALVNLWSQLPLIPNLPLLTNPYKATVLSRDNILLINDKPQYLSMLSSPYSALSQGFSKIPVTLPYEYTPMVSSAIVSSGLQVSPAAPCVTMSSESSISSPIMPYFSDIKLLPTFNEPKSKIRPSQGSLATPLPTPYDQYVVPITTPPLETPITSQYMSPLSQTPIPQYVSSILPTQTILQSLPLKETSIHYQSNVPSSIGLTSSSKNTNIYKRPTVADSSAFNNIFEPVSKLSYFTTQNSLPTSLSSPVPLSNSVSNVVYSEITPQITKQPFLNTILPTTSLFTTSKTDFKVPINILSPLHNSPRYSFPSLSVKKSLKTAPCFMPSKPIGQKILPQIILKPITYFSNDNIGSLSSLPLIQPLERKKSYQTQSVPNVQYTNQVPTQDAALSLSPMCTSSLETLPNRLGGKSSVSKYVIPSVDYTPFYSLASIENLLVDPISVVPTNPVPSSKLTPLHSIISSNPLQTLDLEPNSFPITYPAPLSLSPLVKSVLPQKPCQQEIQNLHHVSQLPIDTVPLLLPSASPFVTSHLLNNYQTNDPLLPMHHSKLNMVPFAPKLPSISSNKENFPSDSLSLADSELYSSPIIQYLPTANNMPSTVSKLPNTSHYNYVPSQKLTHFPTNVSPSKMAVHLNYHVLEPSSNLAIKTNIVNADKPIEDSGITAPVVSPLSLGMNTIKKMVSYQVMPDFKDTFSQLPLVQQTQSHPIFTSNHVPLSKPTHITSPSSHITSKYQDLRSPPFPIPLLLPEETKSIDISNYIPVSPIYSEPLIANDSLSNTIAPLFTDGSLQNLSQSHPYTTLFNTDLSPSFKPLPLIQPTTLFNTDVSPLPLLQCPYYSKQIPQSSELHISPLQNRVFTECPPITHELSSSPKTLLSPLIERPGSLTQKPLYPTLISKKPQYELPLQIFAKSLLPLQEKTIEVIPDNGNVSTLLNKYRPSNIITTLQDSITNAPSELVSEKPVNSLFDIPKAEYFEKDLNEGEEYENKNILSLSEAENIRLDETIPDVIESKSMLKSYESLNVLNYNKITQIPQRLSKLDNIGIKPQVITIPTHNTLPMNPHIDVKIPYPEISKDFTTIPTRHFGSVPKLYSTLRPNEYCTKISDTPIELPLISLSDTKNYFNPAFETPNHHTPYKNNNIKYSGYKTYQIPTNTNLGIPSQYIPTVSTYSPSIPADKSSYMHQISYLPHIYRPTKTLLPPNEITTPLQTKLGLNNNQQSPELNEYNDIEDMPVTVDNINEDNELKTSLVNYLNVKNGIIDNLCDNNEEITIPIGNIAIFKKEPCNSNIVETNNPSIDLKVWKSKVKVLQAELKLKLKELKVNNFMPIVNNIDKYDLEEIREIVKKYINEKYGNHIEINEPYTIENKYSVIKDFDYTVDDTFNLLWPTYNV